MILEILILALFIGICVLSQCNIDFLKKMVFMTENTKLSSEPVQRQQKCGATIVNDNGKNTFIHTGCSVDRKATFTDTMPGESPFGEDGFEWDQENGLMGTGTSAGYN